MPPSEYVLQLREKIGRGLLLLPSVACVVRDEAARILLVHHVEGRWMLPGGAVDPGESPADAAVRETWEESGLLVEPTRLLGAYGGAEFQRVYANGDAIAYVPVLFAARVLEGELRPDGRETDDARWVDETEALELLSEPGRTAVARALRGEAFARPEWRP